MSRFTDNELDDQSIDAQAAAWFARNRERPEQPADKAFEQWRADPAHARAYAEFESLWADLAKLKQLNRPATAARPGKARWRTALLISAGLLCAALSLAYARWTG